MIKFKIFEYNTLHIEPSIWIFGCKDLSMHVYICTLIIIYIHILASYSHVHESYYLRNCCVPYPCCIRVRVVPIFVLLRSSMSWCDFTTDQLWIWRGWVTR